MAEKEEKKDGKKEEGRETIVVGPSGSLDFDETFSVLSPQRMREEGLVIHTGEDKGVGVVVFSLSELSVGHYQTFNGIRVEKTSENNWLINNHLLTNQELETIAIHHDSILQEEKKRKEEEKRQKKHDATFSAKTFQELPQDVQQIVISSHLNLALLSQPFHFEILVNILRFTDKRDFRTYETKTRHPRPIPLEEHPVLADLIRRAQFSILVDEKAKRFFRSSELTGKGGYGKVFFAEQTKPKKGMVAIKKTPHQTEKQKMANYLELGCLMTCQHPNVVKLLSSYSFKDELWIITEFMAGGTLLDARKIRQFDEGQIAFVAREVLKALEFIHYKQLVHRDIKSNNIMLTTLGDVKLIDLGLCDDVSNGPLSSMCGSLHYMSPEMIQNKSYSFSIDIWSFGVTMLEMVTGHVPYHQHSRIQAMFKIATEGVKEILSSLSSPQHSPQLIDFLSLCLQLDFSERPPAAFLLDHPFIKMANTKGEMITLITEIFIHNALMESGIF